MDEIREENKRLKMVLHNIKKDYNSLQLRIFDIVKEDQDLIKKSTDDNSSADISHQHETEEAELVSLSLGRSPKEPKSNNIVEDHSTTNLSKIRDQDHDHDDQDSIKANLTLGLGTEVQLTSELVNEPSPENSSELEVKESSEAKTPKTMRNSNGDDEVSQAQAKRARVSVRARCDTPTVSKLFNIYIYMFYKKIIEKK